MNLKLFLTLLLTFSWSFITFGQHEFCRMVGASSLILTEDCSYETLPNGNVFRIAIHVIRTGNGEGGIIETQNLTEEVLIQHVETILNEAFDFPSFNPYESPCTYVENGFTFNAISLDYIDEDVYYQPLASESFEEDLGMNNGVFLSSLIDYRNNCSAINIYLSDEYCDVDFGFTQWFVSC